MAKIPHSKVRNPERLYRALFEHANDAILIFEPKGEIVLEANRQALKLYGFKRHEFVGRSLLTLSAHPVKGRQRVRDTLTQGKMPMFESIQYRKDGTPLVLSITAAVVDYNGRRAILSINRDITRWRRAEEALRASEQQLRAARDASLDAIYVLESVRNRQGRITDFRYVDVNRRGAALVSMRPKAMLGRTLLGIFPSAQPSGFMDKFRRVAETRRPLLEEFEVNVPGIRGTWLHQQVVPLADGILITTRDITAAKRVEAELKTLPRRIIEAQETERRRVARELHDSVSQLLASARYRLHALEERLPSGTREFTAGAQDAVDRALSEVRRISHGLRPRELDDLGLAVALRMLAVDFEARTGLAVTLRGAQLEPRLSADREEACYRIVQEALTNIERHAQARRVTLHLTRSRTAVRLVIRDDGRGMDRDGRPPGLGLMHMRERAEQVGGIYQIGPARGGGTEIIARLPLVPGNTKS